MIITNSIVTAKGGTSSDSMSICSVIEFNSGTLIAESKEEWVLSRNQPNKLPESYWWRTSNSGPYNEAPGSAYNWNKSHNYVEFHDTNPGYVITFDANSGQGTMSDATAITSAAITDVDAPVSNTTLDTAAVCETTGVSSTTPSVTWSPSGSKAEYGKIYTADITLSASEGYKFADGVTATVNGNPATNVTRNTDGTLTVTYEFPKTEKHNIELTFNTAVRDSDPVRNPTINSGYKIPLCIFVEDTNKNGDFTDDKTVLLDNALVEEFIAQPKVTMTYEEFMATFKSELGIDEIKTKYTGGDIIILF